MSRLPRKLLDACLGRLNLTDYFDGRVVCAEDDRDRAQQAFLHAAVELGRQPSRVVVFSDSVDDLIAAHEAEMRAVGVVGAPGLRAPRRRPRRPRRGKLRPANVRRPPRRLRPVARARGSPGDQAPPVDTLYEDLDDDATTTGPISFPSGDRSPTDGAHGRGGIDRRRAWPAPRRAPGYRAHRSSESGCAWTNNGSARGGVNYLFLCRASSPQTKIQLNEAPVGYLTEQGEGSRSLPF